MNTWLISLRAWANSKDRAVIAKRRVHASLTILLVSAIACNLPSFDQQAQESTRQEASLELTAQAIRLKPGEITYSVHLTNRSDLPLGNLTLEFDIPSGGTVLEVITTPLSSAMQQGNENVTWVIPSLSANTIIGPFAYRVIFDGEPGPIKARASWKVPGQGEVSGVVTTVEDASQAAVTVGMVAGPLTEIPGSGIQYFVPFGDRGQVTLERLEQDPGEGLPDELAWVGAYEVTKEKPGSAIFVVPLRRPVPPFTLVRVFADEGDGFREQTVMGVVAPDGLHASFAADGASKYALGVDELGFNTASTTLVVEVGQNLANRALLGLFDFEIIFGKTPGLLDLINSLRTDVVVVIDTGDGWFAIDTTGPADPPSSGDCAEDEQGLTCYFEDGEGGPCDGHGGGVTTVNYKTGSRESACADGTVITECVDDDEDGYCVGHDSNDNNPNVHFAPIPGPCPHGICFSQTGTDELYSVGQLDGLATSIVGLIDLRGMTEQQRLDLASPPSTQVQAPGTRLDASNMRAVVAVIENLIVLLFPAGQQVSVRLVQPVLAGGPLPATTLALTDTPTPTLPPILVPVTLPPILPSETIAPPQDTDGPGIKGVSASPDVVFASQPKGCNVKTSKISAGINDPSGVQSAEVIFVGAVAGSVSMSPIGGKWQAVLGPFDAPGAVNYQIRAFDNLGNRSDTDFFTLTVNACIP